MLVWFVFSFFMSVGFITTCLIKDKQIKELKKKLKKQLEIKKC